MKKRMSWYLALPLAAGLALVLVAVTSWASGPTAHAQSPTPTVTNTPAPTATPNPDCDLSVSKSDSPTTVGEGGEITYTITVTNDGSGNGDCTDLDVVDAIPDDTDCVDATVASSSDIDEGDFDINGCDSSGDVTWSTNTNLDTDDSVVLTMVVELTSGAQEDDTITNEACATSTNDVGGDCDSERTTVGAPTTATPQPTATRAATVQPIPTVIAPPPIPTARPLATIAPPITGTGPDGGSGPLALGLGLVGVCLLLVSGAAMVKRTR